MFKWLSNQSTHNENNVTTIYVCAKSPIMNSDPSAYNAKFFEIASSTLYNSNKDHQIFSTLEQAYKHVDGRGNLAIYEVIVPTNATKKIGNSQICLDIQYHIKNENIKSVYSLFIGKDKFIANPHFNLSKISHFENNIKDNPQDNRAPSPPRSSA